MLRRVGDLVRYFGVAPLSFNRFTGSFLAIASRINSMF